MLGAHFSLVKAAACDIQTVFRSKAHIADLCRNTPQQWNRVGTGTISERGLIFAVAFGEFDHVRVDFVLQQRRTGGRTTPRDIAFFDDDDI